MIIGNGLIARAFKKSNLCFNDAIIIASGVSNSSETCTKEFKREEELIRKTIYSSNGCKVVYFSSGSIYSQLNSSYIKHKKDMESLIFGLVDNALVIRLANVIGETKNKTMIPFFIEKIKTQELFCVCENAKRQFIYIDDIVSITRLALNSDTKGVVNIASENSYSASYVVSLLEKMMRSEAKVKLISGGEEYYIPVSNLGFDIEEYGLSDVNYLKYALEKMHSEY